MNKPHTSESNSVINDNIMFKYITPKHVYSINNVYLLLNDTHIESGFKKKKN